MKADPTHQLALLDVAELDSRAAQLRHQRTHLPELAEISTLEAERTQLTDQVRDARIVVDDLTVEQAKADRAAGVLRVNAAWVEAGSDPVAVARELAAELAEMARWLGLAGVQVLPRGDLAGPLEHAVRREVT